MAVSAWLFRSFNLHSYTGCMDSYTVVEFHQLPVQWFQSLFCAILFRRTRLLVRGAIILLVSLRALQMLWSPPPQPLLLQQTTISKLFLSKKFSLNKKFRGVNVETKISQFSNKHLRIRQAACSSELCAVLQHNIVRTQSFIGRSLDTRRTFSDAFVITAIYIRSTECLGTMLPYDRSILVLSQN